MAADRTARRLEPNALTDSKVPTEIADELERRGSGVRILLFRQRSASRDGPVFYQAHSQGAFPSLVKSPLSDPSALLDVDFEALANGKTGPGVPVDDPTYLVCTHGRHDICCADKGRPLYRALSGVRPSATWEVLISGEIVLLATF